MAAVCFGRHKPISGAADLVEAQTKLLRNPIFSDLTVTCKSRTWKCQRAILAARCEFFRAAIASGFKEAENNTVDLKDDHPDGIDMMLLYLYTFQEPDWEANDPTTKIPIYLKVEATILVSDKYQVSGLLNLAQSKLSSLIGRDLKLEYVQSDFQRASWINVFRRLWQSESKAFQSARTMSIEALARMPSAFVSDPAFQKFLELHPAFALHLIRRMAREIDGSLPYAGAGLAFMR